MDLSCEDKILQGVRELIKENILPRLTQIEQEVQELRRVCWPVCQSLRETSQLTDIENKRRFLSFLDSEEVNMLLLEKASVSGRPLLPSTTNFTSDEYHRIHISRMRSSNEYSRDHPIDLIFEQSPNKVSTSHGL